MVREMMYVSKKKHHHLLCDESTWTDSIQLSRCCANITVANNNILLLTVEIEVRSYTE